MSNNNTFFGVICLTAGILDFIIGVPNGFIVAEVTGGLWSLISAVNLIKNSFEQTN